MDKERQKWEQEDVEEQEEEEPNVLVRKSRNENDSKTTEIAAANVEEINNGVSESNEQTEFAANGAENEESVLEEEQKVEEPDGVLENESEAINGEQKSENLVFYDKTEGIWKCRLCSWTYGNGSFCVDHIQNHNGLLHTLMNVKTLNFESEGVESASTCIGEKQIVKVPGHNKLDASSLDFVAQDSSASAAIDNKYKGVLENDTFSSSNPQTSFQERGTDYKASKEIESAEVDLDDLEVAEFDVERVIKRQTTHDLYCPNCNSCITKRVILRKRKRRIRISDEEVKRNKIEADFTLGTGSVQSIGDEIHPIDEVGDNDTQPPIADEDERDRGPDIFRCLSCFSFFIPTRNGFKLFQIFGDKGVRDAQVPPVKKNWFTYIFASKKQEAAPDQGSSIQTDVPKGNDVGILPSSNLGYQIGQPSSSNQPCSPSHIVNNDNPEGADMTLPSPKQEHTLNGKVIIGAEDRLDVRAKETVDTTFEQFDAYTEEELKESKVDINRGIDLSVATLPPKTPITNGKSAEDNCSFSQQDGLKMLISTNNGSPAFDNSEGGQIPSQTIQPGASTDLDVIQLSPSSVSTVKASDVDGNLNISVSIPHQDQDIKATILTESVENRHTDFTSNDSGHMHSSEVSQHIITKTKFEIQTSDPLKVNNISALKDAPAQQGKDTVITIDTQSVGSSQTLQDTISPTETTSLLEPATLISVADRERAEARKELEIEVIKSIVYGGLAESITSLSVVSSAAGGGAATLNTLALGAANLIGGFFIICQNLWELKSDHIEQVANQVSHEAPNPTDRYKELLGRRHNFILHFVVAIISYLVFGSVAPVVYGFSFYKTNDKQLKLIVTAAASLLCIIVLAMGRAYIRRPPKPYLKSVISFIVLGFMVSGVSYAAGILVERLLEKLGLFQPISDLILPPNEMITTGSERASY